MKYVFEDAIRRLIKFKGACCMSCHEDDELYGDYLIELDLGKNRYSPVCCTVSIAYDEWCERKEIKK